MSKLQQKKNELRKSLSSMGILSREGVNDFDKYAYFSEAQYKKLFTDLFAKHGIELTMTTVNVDNFEGSVKMPYGRRVTCLFTIKDTDTDDKEESVIVGEALDKADKAIYKAYTGALKYFLANTFLVATDSDPEKSGSETVPPEFIEPHQKQIILSVYKDDNLERLLVENGIKSIDQMPFNKAVSLIEALRKMSRNQGQ